MKYFLFEMTVEIIGKTKRKYVHRLIEASSRDKADAILDHWAKANNYIIEERWDRTIRETD